MSSIEDKLALANDNVPKTYMAGKSCKDITDFSNFCRNGARIDMLDYLNTSSAKTFESMFENCTRLTTIPKLNTCNVTTFKRMFYGCYNLTSIPQLDTSKGILFISMFYGCSELTTIPKLDTSKGSNFERMFSDCYNLTSIPQLDTTKGTNFVSMFYGCYNLTTIPQLNTMNGTSFRNMFWGCTNLISLPTLDNRSITDINCYKNIFTECYGLQSVSFSHPIKYSINLKDNSQLDPYCLQNIIESLYPYDSATQTITLSSESWQVLESNIFPPSGSSTWKEYITNVKKWKYA